MSQLKRLADWLPENLPHPRVLAKSIDLAISFALGVLILYPIGPLLGFLYSLLADALPVGKWSPYWQGQSIGKKIMGLRVLTYPGKSPIELKHSVLRNAPVGVFTFFGIIPVWGWLIMLLLGLPLLVLEAYLLIKSPEHRRLGDTMGETQVVLEPKLHQS